MLVALTGVFGSGKNHVADYAGLTEIGSGDPIHEITEAIFGSRDKQSPRIRRIMQEIGAAGRGYKLQNQEITDGTIDYIKSHGAAITKRFSWVNWSEGFGASEEFWISICIERMRRDGLYDNAAISLRYPKEVEYLKHFGFVHFHVMCSRKDLMLRRASQIGSEEFHDSEEYARSLDAYPTQVPIIWNGNLFEDGPDGYRTTFTMAGFKRHVASY
jgi:hypothetical protein